MIGSVKSTTDWKDDNETMHYLCHMMASLPPGEDACLGSSCMAWRRAAKDSPKGYCGMAGKPNA